MTSKLDAADAREWLESLQQVGEGWWRQVGLAIRAGAPKALRMTRKEFAGAIGQRLVDPREAIIELHGQGLNPREIADILGVSPDRTVARILAEEGLIEPTPSVIAKAREQGYELPGVADADSDPEPSVADADAAKAAKLQAEIDRLKLKAQGDEAKRKREIADLKEKEKKLRRDIIEEKRRMRDEAQSKLTDQERDRAFKEAEAWANEQGQKILTGIAKLAVERIVSELQEAAEDMRLLIEQNAVSATAIKKIEAAYGEFLGEFNVARMATEGR